MDDRQIDDKQVGRQIDIDMVTRDWTVFSKYFHDP